MKNTVVKLFIISFNIIAPILVYGNEKSFFHIDAIWIDLLLTLLITWNIILLYLFIKDKQ